MDSAATTEDLQMLKWGHENIGGDICSVEAMNGATRCGHLNVVQWLDENRPEGCTTDAMDKAKSGEMLEWLDTYRSEGYTDNAVYEASISVDFDKLEYLKHLEALSGRLLVGSMSTRSFSDCTRTTRASSWQRTMRWRRT